MFSGAYGLQRTCLLGLPVTVHVIPVIPMSQHHVLGFSLKISEALYRFLDVKGVDNYKRDSANTVKTLEINEYCAQLALDSSTTGKQSHNFLTVHNP